MDGFLYVLTNPFMPGLVKIGWTTDVSRRAAELSAATGVPAPFEVAGAYPAAGAHAAEQRIHTRLALYRVNAHREFFRASPAAAVQAAREEANRANATAEKLARFIADHVPGGDMEDAGAALALLGMKEVAARVQALTGAVFDNTRAHEAA